MLEKGGVLSSSSSRSINNNKEVISAGTSPSSVTGGIRSTTTTTTTMQQQQQQQQQYLQPPPIAAAPAATTTIASPLPLIPPLQSQSQQPPLRERRDSHSVVSQTNSLPDQSDAWQWQENNDPDDQEQALFEQRLCEDVYGVAVRKINQNGKSNLRYVKCSWVDASELSIDQQQHPFLQPKYIKSIMEFTEWIFKIN